jgi:hypothetical protein
MLDGSNMTRREFVQHGLTGATVIVAGTAVAKVVGVSPNDDRIQPQIAVSTNDFLNSIGICSSITGRGETLTGTINALNYTGIRWIRCGLEDRISVNDMIDLHNRTGAKICYGLLSGGTSITRLLNDAGQLASAGALLAIEGNNEPNNWGITYQEQAGGAGATPPFTFYWADVPL